MEYYIADNLECPECHVQKLNVIGNHTPSLDIICSNCNNKFEVKSKCLSVKNLPNDIKLPHGSYVDYVNRLNEGLNLIVIIYGVDRINKMIKIREVLYANNNLLNKINIVKVSKRIDNNSSTILIKNKEKLVKLKIQTKNTILTFKNDFDNFNYNHK
jgi:type II restriction enzyme